MATRDLQTQTTILLPAVDFYQRGYQKQTIGNYDTLNKVTNSYLNTYNERIAPLEKRIEALLEREKKVYETIQGLVGAKSVIRIETPKTFPLELDYDAKKVAMDTLKADKTIPKNERMQSQLEKNENLNFHFRSSKIKGDPSKVDSNEINEVVKNICQSNKVPMLFPINFQPQNTHIDKLYLPRTQQTKRNTKFIDGMLIFNTKSSIFHHYEPEKLAEKRPKKKAGPEANPILESGNLTQFSMGVDKTDDQMESGYVPKTTSQIQLLDAPADPFLSNSMTLGMDFLNSEGGLSFGSDSSFFDSIMNIKPQQAPAQTTSTPTAGSTQSISTSSTAAGGSVPAPPSGVIPAPPPLPSGATAIPPAPAGSIPPPPPLASILSKKDDYEGGNVPDSNAPLKPIADDKSS
jgi:hypothetical protein